MFVQDRITLATAAECLKKNYLGIFGCFDAGMFLFSPRESMEHLPMNLDVAELANLPYDWS
jgi:hypothetical protein